MTYNCYVLRLVHTEKGEVAIIDFPKGKKPKIGDTLSSTKNSISWRIVGLGMPIFVDLTTPKIETHYGNDLIWDCLLEPVGHSMKIEMNDILLGGNEPN